MQTLLFGAVIHFIQAGPDNIYPMIFRSDTLKKFAGKSITEIAQLRFQSPEDTIIDLVIEDKNPIWSLYFSVNKDNLNDGLKIPWVSICSDERSIAPEGVFLNSPAHPRAYGSFSRFLGKFIREDKKISLEEGIRRLTSLPAQNLKLFNRGMLKKGYFADIVVFNPHTIIDNATYQHPHQFATGIEHVLVNGELVLKNGAYTGAMPGRFIQGPGFMKN